MEKRDSDIKFHLIELISRHTRRKSVTPDNDLEWDLGITGDDAVDLILEYGRAFNVDVATFQYDNFFHEEGLSFVILIKKLFRRPKGRKPFTLQHLLNGIETGVLYP